MKNLILAAILSINAVGFSQKIQSEWVADPINIDGQKQDWTIKQRLADNGTGILYGISNDEENLYMYFEFPNSKLQMKTMKAGLNLTIQAKTKPKLKASIAFPIMEKPSRQANSRDIKTNKNGNPKDYLLQAGYSEIEGFLKTRDIISRNNGQHLPFTFDIGWNTMDRMLFELQIPLSELFSEPIVIKDLLSSQIKIKATLNAIEQPTGERQGNGQGGMQGGGRGIMNERGQGGGGSRPGGMGGQGGQGGGRPEGMGGQGGNSEEMQWMSSEQNFTIKVLLSSGANLPE